MKALLAVLATLALAGPLRAVAFAADAAAPADVTQTVVSVEVDGAKFWLPSTIVAKKGQTVRLTLSNKVPGEATQHGFTIPAYGVTEVVTRGEDKTVTFKADKEGIFPMFCQLHPAHVGGQLVVLP